MYTKATFEVGENMASDMKECMEILSQIIIDSNVLREVERYCKENYNKIQRYKQKLLQGKWVGVHRKKRIVKLCAVTACLAEVKKSYIEKGIDLAIFYATMSDIDIWVKDCGARFKEIGLEELNWIRLHIKLEIFKLGRLQFQISRYGFGRIYEDGDDSLKFGQKCLNLHIPRGEKLNLTACKESIERACKFFAQYYPDITTELMVCHSWLLYPNNKFFMEDGSNIAKFAKMFDIVGSDECPTQTFLWVFDKKISNAKLIMNKKKTGSYMAYAELPKKTLMQEKLAKYISDGGMLGGAKGVLVAKKVLNNAD